MTTMLYRFSEKEKSRKEKIHGLDMDYIVIEDDEVDSYLDNYWSKTPTDAKELYDENMSGEPNDDPSNIPEFDSDEMPWDERINLKDKSRTKKGAWRIIPGTKKEVLEAVREEIKPKE